jgi:chromosome segregation ATPase
MTITELQGTIIKIQEQLNSPSIDSLDSRALSAMRKALFENFKITSFTNNQERQEKWTSLQLLLDTLKEKQAIQDKEDEKFAAEAETKITAVKTALGDETNTRPLSKEEIEALKKQFAETGEFIRQSNWPNKERRTEAWEKFKTYREALRLKEDVFYNQLREERNRLTEQSSSLTQAVLYAIRACHPDADAERLSELGVTIHSLTNAGLIQADEPVQHSISKEEIKALNPLKIKSEGLRDLRKFVIENRDGITREDKQRIFAAIDEVQADLDKAWTLHKEELQQKKEAWEERKKEREIKHAEWELKQKDFLARLEDRLAKQYAFKEKLAVVYEKQNSFWERLEKRIINQQDYIQQIQVQLNDLEDKYAMASDSKYREKISEWIKGKYAKIEEVETDIKDMEEKITDAKKNIEELPGRMNELDKSIEDLQNKIAEVKQNLAG